MGSSISRPIDDSQQSFELDLAGRLAAIESISLAEVRRLWARVRDLTRENQKLRVGLGGVQDNVADSYEKHNSDELQADTALISRPSSKSSPPIRASSKRLDRRS